MGVSKEEIIAKVTAYGQFLIESLMEYQRMVTALQSAFADDVIDPAEKAKFQQGLDAARARAVAAIKAAKAKLA